MQAPHSVRHVAVLGAGTIGASWAAWFLSRGLSVAVSDPDPAREAYVRRMIANAWPVLARLGRAAAASPENWTFTTNPADAVRNADFVQENAPERAGIKRELYAAIEPALPPETILASSSSGLTMTSLQEGLATPHRFAIGHPFNPPHLIPLVEVVGGAATAPETIAWCMDFYRHVGKEPIHLKKEALGHLANRLQAALWREAINAVASGLASVEDVDRAVAYGPGLRWAIMGPALTFHLGGGDGGLAHMFQQFRPSFEAWWQTMGTPTLTDDLCQKMVEGVLAETKGRSIQDLERERDTLLVALQETIAHTRGKG
jgi:3-hydroxyacyl-CoA dehydrogenase